jgi:hypothetical protein
MSEAMKSFTFLPRVILGLLLFVTGGGISLATDVNTVNDKNYTFTVGTNNTVTLSQIDNTPLSSYKGTSIDLASAYSDGTFTVDGTTYTITSIVSMKNNKTIKTVKMPSTVTSLPNSCFDGCSALTTVSFPGLKTIGEYAFQNCSALTGTLTIPSGADVKNQAFSGCTGFTSLVINTGTTDNATSFYGNAFLNMGGVTKVEIVDGGNNKIPDNTFKGAEFNASVDLTIPTKITTIGDYAFSGANFPKTLDLSKFTFFGSHAFDGNTTLANNGVTFAKNTTIGEAAFSGCTSLEGELTIPKGTYNNRVFDGCKKVTELVIYTGSKISYPWNNYGCFGNMQGVTKVTLKDDDDGDHTIPAYFFGNASFSKDVTLTIDKNITGIGDYAFNHANFPTTLDLSSQFTSYGASAFEDNTAFKGNANGVIAVQKPTSATSDVTVGSKAFWNTQATEIDIYPNMSYSGCGPTDAYYSNGAGPYNGKNITKVVFENSVTSIPDYLFLHASYIPATCEVTWPTEAITHIGKGAFCGVQFKAAIPSKMKDGTIDDYAYARNTISRDITIPTGCKEIRANAFYDCDKITSVTIPNTTTYIGNKAFAECALLSALNLPTLDDGTVPNLVLDESIIDSDPSMRGITITNAVKTIYSSSSNSSNNTFSGLTSPFTVTLQSDLVTATKSAVAGGTFFSFKNNGTTASPNTLNVVVADGVTTIPEDMFSENSSLSRTQANINVLNISGNDLTEIKSGAFQDNQELTKVDLSGAMKLKKIDDKAFYHCSMTSIDFGKDCDIETIGTSAFEECTSLAAITIGKVKTLGDRVFYDCTSLANINQDADGNNDLTASSLVRLGQYTFGGCTSLQNIYFPSTLMRIHEEAFIDQPLTSAAAAATNDKVFIRADVPYSVNTFCRGFSVKMNSSDGRDSLKVNDQSFSMWVPVKVDKVNRKLVLRPFAGTYLPSEEPKSADVQNTSTSYSDVPAGIIFAPSNWSNSQYTPYDEEGDPTTPATKADGRQLNLRVKFTDKTTTVDHSHSTGELSKRSLLRGYIDTLEMTNVSNKYLIWTKDLALHPVDERTKFPAGKCYIYDDPNSADAGSGDIASAKVFQIFLSDEPIYDGNTITGIKDIQRQNVNVDDNYYTLDGKIVSFPTEGIYIHHGKKVIIRRI